MKITAQLKKWLVENCDAKEDATDDELKKAAGTAMAEGKLSVEKYAELSKDTKDEEANEFNRRQAAIADSLGKLTELLAKQAESKDEKPETETKDEETETKDEKPETKGDPEKVSKMVGRLGDTGTEEGASEIGIRVKEAAERYSHSGKSARTYPGQTKTGAPHPQAGQPMRDYDEGGRDMETATQREEAVCGSFAKLLVSTRQCNGNRREGYARLPQHDKDLLQWGMDNLRWSGATDGGNYSDIDCRMLTADEKQALIDDAGPIGSGGLEAAPIVFDDQVIQAPLLNGELYPLVNVVSLDRGRRVEGVATGTVTSAWGGVDNTAILLFNTANYVTAFDTTIFRWQGAIRIGLDFLSDTPINFGQHVTQQFGQRLLEDLDDAIAAGAGAMPTGIIAAAGTTIAFGGVAATLGGYEQIRFGVTKQEHPSALKASAVFCGTEVSYRRARAIPVGAADARRLGGMDYGSYTWMEHPYKLNATLGNTQIFYAILKRYRMYLRRGLTIRTSTEGSTLMLNNVLLITATARYGGQLERGACAARTITAQA